MSSELEHLLRRGRDVLPEPDPETTVRARERALAAVRHRRVRRLRRAALAAVAVIVVAGLGVGIGALVAPTGSAARPIGLGFLPAAGWQVLEPAAPSMPGQPQVAMSANIPFAEDDAVTGLAEPSGLPYSTLLTLPPKGIVVVATFTEQERLYLPRTAGTSASAQSLYPERELPFRLSDGTPFIQYGTQVRPEEPLGQYQLRASLEDWYVDVHVYFGTQRPSPALLSEAQRELDRMVVQTARIDDSTPSSSVVSQKTASPGVVDRTFSCRPSFTGGVYKLEALASRGSGRSGSTWARPAFAALRASISGSAATAVDNYLVWLTAGRPMRDALVPLPGRIALFDFPYRVWGTLAVNRTRCRASKALVPLTANGLTRVQAEPIPEELDCTTPKSVLVRIHAVTESRTTLRSFRNFTRTLVPARSAVIVVQTQAGKRLVYARLSDAGTTRISVAQPPCYPG